MCKDVFDVELAIDLYREKKYQEALDLFILIEKDLSKRKIQSSCVYYYLAILHDILKDHFEAAFWISKAIEKDSMNYFYEDSAAIIFRNITNKLYDIVNAKCTHKEVEKIYDFIKENGRVTSTTQFIYIRHLMKVKHYDQARPLIECELERNPNDKELQLYLKKCSVKVSIAK